MCVYLCDMYVCRKTLIYTHTYIHIRTYIENIISIYLFFHTERISVSFVTQNLLHFCRTRCFVPAQRYFFKFFLKKNLGTEGTITYGRQSR